MTKPDEPIPYRPGMTLMPGQSTVVSVPIPEEVARRIAAGDSVVANVQSQDEGGDRRQMVGLGANFVDISAQAFGKYQFCTLNKKDGMWYADADFGSGGGCGPLRAGALPSPRQDTSELTARARAMHEEAAKKITRDALGSSANRITLEKITTKARRFRNSGLLLAVLIVAAGTFAAMNNNWTMVGANAMLLLMATIMIAINHRMSNR
jgi:hypothetical protein